MWGQEQVPIGVMLVMCVSIFGKTSFVQELVSVLLKAIHVVYTCMGILCKIYHQRIANLMV